jgi:hypothetical protein
MRPAAAAAQLPPVSRRAAVLHLPRHEVRDHLRVGVRAELRARLLQLLAQLAEILDDAVVDDGEALGGVGVGVAFGRPAVGRPAGVPDADGAGQRLAREPGFEVAQLALGPPADELSAFKRGNAGGIIPPVLKPLERIDKQARDRLAPENAHNSAHASGGLLCRGLKSCPEDDLLAVNAAQGTAIVSLLISHHSCLSWTLV